MLVLSDGTKVWLNSETCLEYPLAFGEHSREVRLSGEAYFEVTKDEARCFNVIMEGRQSRLWGLLLTHLVIRERDNAGPYWKW